MNINNQKLAVTLFLLLSAATVCRAQSPADRALYTLQTSLDPRERSDALLILRKQKLLPESAGLEMGRLILSGGSEAGGGAEILPILGEGAIPIIAKLMEDTHHLDTQILTSYAVRRLNPTNESAFLEAVRPILQRRPVANCFPAVLALGAFPLSPTNASAITREIFKIRSYSMQFVAAIMIAQHAGSFLLDAGDEKLFREMQASEYATVRYAGTRFEETGRVLRWGGAKRALPPLTPEEEARRLSTEETLRQLGANALDECLTLLKAAHEPYEKLTLFYSLQYIYPHVKAERIAIAKALRELQVERGSILDKEIQQWLFDNLERSL